MRRFIVRRFNALRARYHYDCAEHARIGDEDDEETIVLHFFRAMELLSDQPKSRLLCEVCFRLLIYCSSRPDGWSMSYREELDQAAEDAIRSSALQGDVEAVMQAQLLQADLYQTCFATDIEKLRRALENLERAAEKFEAEDDQINLKAAKARLISLYADPKVNGGDQMGIERAIAHAAFIEPHDPGGEFQRRDFSQILCHIASLYAKRPAGDPEFNIQKALEYAGEAVKLLASDRTDAWAWAVCTFLQIAAPEIPGGRPRAAMNSALLLSHTEDLIDYSRSVGNIETLFLARTFQQQLSAGPFVLDPEFLSVDPAGQPDLWMGIQRMDIDNDLDFSDASSIKRCSVRLEALLDHPASSNQDYQHFIRLTLAACHAAQGEDKLAMDYARAPMEDAIASIESKHRTVESYEFSIDSRILNEIPVIALRSGNILQALEYWEYLNCRDVARCQEDLLYIDYSANRESLMRRFHGYRACHGSP